MPVYSHLDWTVKHLGSGDRKGWKLGVGVKVRFKAEGPESERKQCMEDRPTCKQSRKGDRAKWAALGKGIYLWEHLETGVILSAVTRRPLGHAVGLDRSFTATLLP